MSFRIAASLVALVVIVPPVSAGTRLPAPVVRDHRAGAPGGGVVVTKTPSAPSRQTIRCPGSIYNGGSPAVCRDHRAGR